jgi:YHS domain-containing protein
MVRRIFLLAVFLIVGTSFSFNTYAQEKTKEEKKENTTVEQKADSNQVFNLVCPVSHEEADPQITYTYKGVTYALCCKRCLKKFKNDPEKYISRLSADGKSIKKKKD